MINCVYIHIPFCEKKCNYCAFCSYESQKFKKEYLNALIKEIKFYYKGQKLKSLYLGGGTPSILDIKEIQEIIECFDIENCETTIEINPNSLDKSKLQGYKKLGVNRLSLGAEDFSDERLKLLGRLHSKKDIYNAIKLIKDEGFDNLSIDLMYGIVNQNLADWRSTLEKALELDIAHISLYGLKIEKGTYFYKNRPKNIATADEQASMYELAIKLLKEKYIHYEFSNFAISDSYRSIHNLAYWKRLNYFGFGLSASGFVENKRYTNTTNMARYIKNPIEKDYETLSKNQEIEEEIFLGLRLKEGINLDKLSKKYDMDIYQKYSKIFEKYINSGFMEKCGNNIKLTIKGILVSNEILCEFIEL